MNVIVEEARQVGHFEDVIVDEAQIDEHLWENAHKIVHEIAEGQKDQVENALAMYHLFARKYQNAQQIAHEANVVEFHLDAATHHELGYGRETCQDFFVVRTLPKVIVRVVICVCVGKYIVAVSCSSRW